MHPGTAGAIAGSVIGVMGGVIGCGVAIMNATKPRERALVVRLSAFMALWIAALLAWILLMPTPWNSMAALLSLPVFAAIPWMNRRARRARELDQADARAGETAP